MAAAAAAEGDGADDAASDGDDGDGDAVPPHPDDDDQQDPEAAEEHVSAAVEDLVDGMNLDSGWAYRYLEVYDPPLAVVVHRAVNGRAVRLEDSDPGPDFLLTRAVRSYQDGSLLMRHPGRG
ncbi:hypothetical protein CDD83_8880 [Cordyceps sp. RAO-2017]|nr:hypothetical protein CDD83_8880 [Cordyceps sp. RAO-2017]